MGLRKHIRWMKTAHRDRERLQAIHALCRPTDKTLRDSGRLTSYLYEQGWLPSAEAKRPIDRLGNPLPWLTYPAIEFLTRRVPEDVSVFEYGAGYSTLWWRQRAGSVISCEHDAAWAAEVAGLADGATVLSRSLDDGTYVAEITKHPAEFDVVVIDGRERVACARNAPPALTKRGVMVWDNSDRHRYQEGCASLVAQGFRQVDFFGMSPGNSYGSCTSVFYRDGNCLGL